MTRQKRHHNIRLHSSCVPPRNSGRSVGVTTFVQVMGLTGLLAQSSDSLQQSLNQREIYFKNCKWSSLTRPWTISQQKRRGHKISPHIHGDRNCIRVSKISTVLHVLTSAGQGYVSELDHVQELKESRLTIRGSRIKALKQSLIVITLQIRSAIRGCKHFQDIPRMPHNSELHVYGGTLNRREP